MTAKAIYIPPPILVMNPMRLLAPAELEGLDCEELRFERQVWYNQAVRDEAWQRISSKGFADYNILVGFSKSGLGPLNIALEHPDAFQASLVFDSPVCRQTLPPWETEAFYQQSTWAEDLPLHKVEAIAALSQRLQLVLISGELFAEEMQGLHRRGGPVCC